MHFGPLPLIYKLQILVAFLDGLQYATIKPRGASVARLTHGAPTLTVFCRPHLTHFPPKSKPQNHTCFSQTFKHPSQFRDTLYRHHVPRSVSPVTHGK